MHRTNIYLRPEQEAALDARARVEGASRSDLIRRIIDEHLGIGDTTVDWEEVDAALAEARPRLAAAAADLFADDPDLRIE